MEKRDGRDLKCLWYVQASRLETFLVTPVDDSTDGDYDPGHEAIFSKFEAFLARASSYGNIFGSSSSTQTESKKRIILLEDLPNILHTDTRSQFHDTIQALLDVQQSEPVPIIFIVSDTGTRGEASDERLATGFGGRNNDHVIDIRTVLPKNILCGPYVTQIRYFTLSLFALTCSHHP